MMPGKYISKKSYGKQYFIKKEQRTGAVLFRIDAIMEPLNRIGLLLLVYKTKVLPLN